MAPSNREPDIGSSGSIGSREYRSEENALCGCKMAEAIQWIPNQNQDEPVPPGEELFSAFIIIQKLFGKIN
jgi:hypothetical protein